jgi:hypothetical protein
MEDIPLVFTASNTVTTNSSINSTTTQTTNINNNNQSSSNIAIQRSIQPPLVQNNRNPQTNHNNTIMTSTDLDSSSNYCNNTNRVILKDSNRTKPRKKASSLTSIRKLSSRAATSDYMPLINEINSDNKRRENANYSDTYSTSHRSSLYSDSSDSIESIDEILIKNNDISKKNTHRQITNQFSYYSKKAGCCCCCCFYYCCQYFKQLISMCFK